MSHFPARTRMFSVVTGKVTQQGFTLIEVVVASTVGLILLLVAFSFLLETARMAEMMGSRIRLNAEARLMDRMLREGATLPGPIILTGLQNSALLVAGVSSPDVVSMGRQDQRLALTSGASQATSTEENVAIECSGAGLPHPDCVVPGAAVMDGYLASAPTITSDNHSLVVDRHCNAGGGQRSVIAEIALHLMDGHLLGTRDAYVQDQVQRRFYQAMTMQVDCF